MYQTDAMRKCSDLILNNGDSNKTRHKEKNNGWIYQHKRAKLWQKINLKVSNLHKTFIMRAPSGIELFPRASTFPQNCIKCRDVISLPAD